MKKFTVYFECFNKKMKTTVFAENEEKAKEQIKDKIIFHKVELVGKPNLVQLIDEIEEFMKTL